MANKVVAGRLPKQLIGAGPMYSTTVFVMSFLQCLVIQAPSQPSRPGRRLPTPFLVRAERKGDMPEPPQDFDAILEALRSADEKVRAEALDKLHKLANGPVSLELGLKAIRAAAQVNRLHPTEQKGASAALIAVAASRPRMEYVPVIVELFDKFSESAMERALGLLADLEERKAAVAYVEIVRKHADRLPGLATTQLEKKPRHVDVFFPELFNFTKHPPLLADVYRLCYAYSKAGVLTRQTLGPFADHALADYKKIAEKLRPMQKAEGIAWMRADGYVDLRIEAGLLLDVLGFFPADKVEPELRRALEYRDPQLVFFAIVALFRLDKDVDSKHVAVVGANAEMRLYLYHELKKRDRLTLCPEKYRSQAALAEADMVSWLMFPTELGRPPDEIELMKVVPIDTGLRGGIYDYYLFRFRTHEPHWAAKDGWMAGVAGPFRRGTQPTPESLGETFSSFQKWDSKKPEEHVGDVRELLKRWRKYHADQNKQ
jgi:hypothetical protein